MHAICHARHARILLRSAEKESRPVAEKATNFNAPENADVSVLTRGLWWFVVKKVVSTFLIR